MDVESLLPREGESPRETVTRLCRRVVEETGADRVTVWYRDPDGRTVSPYAMWPLPTEAVAEGASRWAATPLDEFPAASEVLEEQRILRIDEATVDDRVPPTLAEDLDLRSLVAVPLVTPGRFAGMLSIEPASAAGADHFPDLLPFVATATGHAIGWMQSERRRARAELLLELTESAAAGDTLDEVLATICARLARELQVRRACVFLVEEGHLVPRMARFADGTQDEALWRAFRAPEAPLPPVLRRVLDSGEPLVIDRPDHPDLGSWWSETFAIDAALAAPIGTPSAVEGVLTLDTSRRRRFDDGQVRLVQAVGSHVANLISRARASEERDAHLRTATAVQRLLADGAGVKSLHEAAEVLARVASEALGTEHAVAYLRDPDGRIVEAITLGVDERAASLLRERLIGGESGLEVPLLERMREPGSVLVDDPGASTLLPADLVDALRLRSYAALPILSTDGPIGVVACAHTRRSPRWTAADRALVEQLAIEGSLVVENAALREQEQRRVDELAHRAFHDALTGLPNRALLIDRVAHALARSTRYPYKLGMLFCDLDRFKTVNDALGHDVGDALLRQVARRLEACVRPVDTVARLAGDEFVLALEELTDVEEAEVVAQRLIEDLRRPFRVGDREVYVTASVGIAVGTKDDEPEELVRRADLAMYRAKRRGGGGWSAHDDQAEESSLERLALENDLRGALDRREFVLHFQPIVDLATEEIVAVEALVRWRHPRLGLLTPGHFIPIAEETGVVHDLGRWVLWTACRRARIWAGRIPASRDLRLNVNVSARSLVDAGFADDVGRTIAETGFPASRLVLEVTESAVMQDADVSIANLERLKALGLRLAVDDFGVGQSSLRYIQQLPLDVLKIDRSFIDGVGSETGDSALVRAILDIGTNLGLSVVAEGIENGRQLQALVHLGCRLGQGNLFGVPLEPDEMERALTAGPPRTGGDSQPQAGVGSVSSGAGPSTTRLKST